MKYGKEIKEQAVLRILNEESTIRKTSQELEVHYTTVRDWVRQYRSKKKNYSLVPEREVLLILR